MQASSFLLIGLGLFLAVFETNRNYLFRYLLGSGVESSWRVGQYTFVLGAPQQSNLPDYAHTTIRTLKISVPFQNVRSGCEFFYAAVVESHDKAGTRQAYVVMNSPRSIIRFAYDHRNLRCESKDISVVSSDLPESMTIQFVDVTLSSSEIAEIPRAQGVHVAFSDIGIEQIREVEVGARPPFRSATLTDRVEKMSTHLAEEEVKVAFGPADSFSVLLSAKLQAAVRDCKSRSICTSIQLAISSIVDVDILKLLDEAQAIGMPVDFIANAGERMLFPGPYDPYFVKNAPWFWTKGNRHLGPFRGILPMHTKFVVFGDDTVISSNMNLVNDTRYRSRALTLEYRNREVAKMFRSLHTMIRTDLFYPLRVDRRDNFLLLVNSERARRYVASAQRPFTTIRTEEGVASNAYGILLEMIASSEDRLALYMSPITPFCFRYRSQRCFLDVLERKAQSGKLLVGLSSFFYINPTTVQPKGAYWNALHLDDDRIWKPNFKPWLPLVKKYPQSFEVYIDKESFFTIHHERFGLLYPDTLLTGSANFVFPFSVNTLEVVRIPSVFKAVEAEVSTFRDEPYFVTSGGQHLSHIGRFEKGCLFFFERAVPHGDEYEPKQYSGTELLGELQRTGFAQSLSEVKLIEPTKESWGPTIADHKFEARTVGEQFQAFSSYVCISNESSGRSVVVRLTPQRSSGAQE